MTRRFIRDPREVVKAGDVVTVKVVEVDKERRRIGLSMLLDDDAITVPEKVKTHSSSKTKRRDVIKKVNSSAAAPVVKKPVEVKKTTLFNTAMADALSKFKRGV